MKRSLDRLSKHARHLLLPALFFVFGTSTAFAADGKISIELNKAEETEQGCSSLFLFDNQSGHQLNRFQVDLVLFDDKGVHARRLLLDMAPLYNNKKVVASFLMNDLACSQIGSMLVNALPSCANSTGAKLDCLGLLDVSSKSSIPLEK
jgi:hypothetical protein